MQKHAFGKKALTLLLTLCMVFTTIAPAASSVVYADSVSDHTGSSSVSSVDPGNASSVATGGEEQNSGSSSTPTQSQPDSTSNSTSVPAADGGGSDSTSAPPANSSSVPTDNGEETSSSSTSEIPEDSSAPENEDGTGEDESEEDKESEGDNSAEEFIPLAIIDPETGDVIEAEVGDEVTLSSLLNRDDILVSYQWQRMQQPTKRVAANIKPIYDYADGEATWYSFPLEEKTEAETLRDNPEAKWYGIEMYYAIVDALDKIDVDSSNVKVAWRTPNFALDGYTITASNTNGTVEIYADKNEQRYVGRQNADGKWEFGNAEELVKEEASWVDIEGATDPTYTFVVAEEDYEASFRCKVSVLDEEYLSKCIDILAEQGIELTEEQKAEGQSIYSIVMRVHSDAWDAAQQDPAEVQKQNFNAMASTFSAVRAGGPRLSADAQWIEGLNGSYQYITKDTYDRVLKWFNEGRISPQEAGRYWTYLNTGGWKSTATANVLDENGMPTGKTRIYNGFTLTDGRLEVNSEWYGKTVYFRVAGSSGTGTAIDIPAYTDLEIGPDGEYIEAASGTRYKKVVTFLNPYVPDTRSVYKNYLDTATKDGWLSDSAGADIHIQLYAVNGEDFNADPQRYMVDAEGNYRMDSVGWGVCTQEEPDISGKAYWVLKDYIANGYGFITGHDTMYSYAGAYYDNFGVDLDEASIDPNDGTTWYYDINSWMPGTTASDHNGNTSTMRGGHFYMNQLMGSNAGNVNSDTVEPSDAPSMILSLGGSHGVYEKNANFGSTQLNVRMNGYSADMAIESPKYRTPTNYPYFFQEGEVFQGAETHTNQQAAFGPIWVDYYGKSIYAEKYGWESEPRYWTIDGQVGTNNFYLSGIGNYLMNQVGHLPENSASLNEARLFTNTVMFVSQRKQCEICAANQNGQETVHFVRRVNTANMDTVLKALQNGGSYWYPIDGCYQLTDSITLPEDWTAIKGFSGHWNSDVYEVKLNSKGTPLLANDKAEGTSGWNLGTNSSKGTQNVFNNSKDMIRTTGVARVLGDLNDLFGTSKSYAGYTVEIRGSDNTKYMSAGEKYSCTVNSDSKYVISNLPCIYDSIAKTGILKARVFDQSGKEVTEYGSIMVNVNKDFWNNDMTIPLYLGSFSAEPVQNYTTYESAQGIYRAEARSNEPFSLARWEYRTSASDSWETLPTDWDVSVNTKVFEPGTTAGTTDLYTIESTLSLNSADPIWNDYDFRAVFTSDAHGEWNTYEYYWLGSKVSNDPFEGASQKKVWKDGATGHLNVLLWPVYAESGDDVTANESASATFRAYGYALSDGTPISVQWEYGRLLYVENGKEVYDWKPVGSDNEFGGLEVVTTPTPVREQRYEQNYALHSVAPNNDLDLFWKKAGFYGVESKLTVKKLDIDQTGIRFRAHFTATSSHGTKYDWYSDIANEKSGSWNTSNGFFGDYKYTTVQDHSNDLTVKAPELWLVTSKSESFADGLLYPDLMTPDEYGQTLLLKTVSATTCTGTAAYQATIYYKPSELTPTPTWQYMTYTDRTPKDWNTQVAQSLGYTGVTVSVKNSAPVPATYNGESGWMAITSTMYIENAPITMYNSENLLKYYFRCVGTTSYETVRRTKSLAATDKWGGLTMDYAIAIWHNGVIGYDGANKVNGITATDANGLAEATKDKTYSDWYYPNLAIKVPTGHHVNTAIVYFDDDAGYNGQDSLLVDTAGLNSLGISVSQNNGKYLILVSGTKDTVETSTWERALREYVGFRTYDEANYTKESIINGTTGGGGIKWVVDEARFAGTQLDPSSGHLYKIVDWGTAVSWDTANQRAQSLDSELGMTGYLAEITSATENSVVSGLLGNRNAWLGGKRLSSGSWRWNKSNTTFGYTNWASGAQTTNANLYMKPGGGWNSAPVVTTTSSDKTYVSGWTAAAGASGTKVAAYTAPIYIPADYPNPHTVTVYFNAHSNSYAGDTGVFAQALVNGSWQMLSNGATTNINGYPWIVCNGSYGNGQTYSLPAGTTAIRGGHWNNAAMVVYSVDVAIAIHATARVTTTTTSNPVTSAVIEYEPQSLGMAITDHSAWDTAVIGTKVQADIEEGGNSIAAVIKGNTKIYDGLPIEPESFAVSGSKGANASLFEVTYEAVEPGNYADYTSRTINGADYRDTGAVNATRYHATVKLTQKAIDAGWVLDTTLSQLECDLVIQQRPVHVYSYHNDKVYDRASAGIINNITPKAADGVSGIIAGDIVQVNTTTVMGNYVDKDGGEAIHNSLTNNGGDEYNMYRNKTLNDLFIVHSDTSDPHHNYRMGSEDFTGAINQRGVYVHSLYLDDPEKPRNVKTYDGTTAATIRDILIDNVVAGDSLGVKDKTMNGVYSTANAGEKLNADGTVQTDRLKKLEENIITASKAAELSGNDYGDYFIEKEEYSGAISRALIEARAKNKRNIYGSAEIETPWNITDFDASSSARVDGWLSATGLLGSDKLDLSTPGLIFGALDKNGNKLTFDETTDVGRYMVSIRGLNEANYPVLKNYIVAVYEGILEIYPREVVVTAADIDWYEEDQGVPKAHSIFEMMNDDEETYRNVGSDDTDAYSNMKLVGNDTVEQYIRLTDGGTAPALTSSDGMLSKSTDSAMKEFGSGNDRNTVFHNGSNIDYHTFWHTMAPPIYLDLKNDQTLHPCDWCEKYHRFTMGTDHWTVTGYELRVNQDKEKGKVLDVATTVNPLGETVQNYELRFVSGTLRVHPKLRFQLKATVPMYVCMYGYAGDGEVVEPEDYGITNYSNGAIEITDIDVSGDGWMIVDKDQKDLLRGEMTMNLYGTQVLLGHNKPANPERWIIAGDSSDDDSGTKMVIPMTCYIAGGNVNEQQESYVTKVTYTIAEHGITVPKVDGVDWPDQIGGEPVFESTED